ncbi:hypothetical protein GOODEAATRI_032288 [Goodea atripinnis]|uniref:EGF-like domain-containing protein n=1 Tax=Goodea atripinnis TaxID=208336 RepID=A0ABV0MWY5_9TELE
MHGSTIKLSCDKKLVGSVLINENSARLVERYMAFKEGLGFGIDQLLEPPGLGAFCDSGRTIRCLRYPSRYRTTYSTWYHDLDDRFSRKSCQRVCQFPSWVQKCCKNHYSRDCQVCPGGVEDPCSSHGNCDDGVTGSGACKCHKGFKGKACDLCASGYYGTNCTGTSEK